MAAAGEICRLLPQMLPEADFETGPMELNLQLIT